MGRTRFVVTLLLGLALTACSDSSPTTPTPPAPGPAAGTAVRVTLTPNDWQLPASGGAVELTIATVANDVGSLVAANVPVTLGASSGSLSVAQVTTDATGHARVTWSGTTAATITARAGEVEGIATIRIASNNPPPPSPGPNPGPGIPPGPTPGPANALIVDIFPEPRGGDASTPIHFNIRVFAADGSAIGPLTYAWDFGDGTTSTEATPTHLFRPADHWTVTLKVTEAGGRVAQASVDIVVGATPSPNVAVTMTATPSTIEAGQSVTFNARTQPNSTSGPVTSYAWTFGDGGTATTTVPTTSHTYTGPGTMTARVTATTTNGTSGSAQATVTVTARTLTVNLSASTTTPASGSSVTFTATLSSLDPPAPGTTFRWDYNNDGTFDESTGTTNTATQIFNGPTGTKRTIKVEATAPDGRKATATIEITFS